MVSCSNTVHIVPVVIGLLHDANGKVLIAERQAEPGLWEFPGGKVELAETEEQALERELFEELGVNMLQAECVLQLQHQYKTRRVALSVFKVRQYQGTPYGKEQQAIRWVLPTELNAIPMLDANQKIIQALFESSADQNCYGAK